MFGRAKITAQVTNSGAVLTVEPSPFFKATVKHVTLTREEYDNFLRWRDGEVLIQNAFPHWTKAQREVLLTGMNEEEWSACLGPED